MLAWYCICMYSVCVTSLVVFLTWLLTEHFDVSCYLPGTVSSWAASIHELFLQLCAATYVRIATEMACFHPGALVRTRTPMCVSGTEDP